MTDEILPSDRRRPAVLALEDAPDGMVPEAEIRWTLNRAQSPQPTIATADWPATRNYRDLVVHELADSEALLHERVASLEDDNEAYRLLLSESLALTVRLTAQLESARRQITFLQRRGRRHDVRGPPGRIASSAKSLTAGTGSGCSAKAS